MVEKTGQEMVIIGRQNGRQMVKEWPEMVKKTSQMAGKRSANGQQLVRKWKKGSEIPGKGTVIVGKW